MIIYSQHFFRRRQRAMPLPSMMPMTIFFALLLGVIVLLIPPISSGINVSLPALNTEPVQVYDDFVYETIEVSQEGGLFINEEQIDPTKIMEILQARHNEQELERLQIFIKADSNLDYGSITYLLQILNNNGIKNITLVGKTLSMKE